MSEEKFESVRTVVAALNDRDVDAYLSCCTDDVGLVPATVAIEGSYIGQTGIERFFADLRDAAPDFRINVERLEAVGQTVIAFERGSASGRASVIGVELELTTLYEFAGPRIKRIQVFVDRQRALEAAGLSE